MHRLSPGRQCRNCRFFRTWVAELKIFADSALPQSKNLFLGLFRRKKPSYRPKTRPSLVEEGGEFCAFHRPCARVETAVAETCVDGGNYFLKNHPYPNRKFYFWPDFTQAKPFGMARKSVWFMGDFSWSFLFVCHLNTVVGFRATVLLYPKGNICRGEERRLRSWSPCGLGRIPFAIATFKYNC